MYFLSLRTQQIFSICIVLREEKHMNRVMPLLVSFLLVGSLFGCGKGSDTATSGGSQTVTLPEGTKFEVDVPQEISTGKNKHMDEVVFPVNTGLVGGNPVLKGAKVEGHLENVVKAQRGKKATLHLVFDEIMFKDGTTQPINAQLLNTKVETKTKGKFLRNAGLILGGAVAGNFVGNKAGTKHGGLAGAAAATAFVLASPGGEVVIKKGTDLELKLKSPLQALQAAK
jgi:hypothetical protein